MNYEDFASRNLEYYMDMVRLVEIKTKYQMILTEEEKKYQWIHIRGSRKK